MQIRLATQQDLTGIATVVNHYIDHGTQHLGTRRVDEEDVGRFALHGHHPCFVALEDGRVAGVAWSAAHKSRGAYAWAVDVAVYVAEETSGQGIGTKLQKRIVDCLRRQGYVSALAIIVVPNEASVRLHEGLGFRPVGVMPRMGFKQGAWRDVGIWHLPLAASDEPPKPVRSVRAVLESTAG